MKRDGSHGLIKRGRVPIVQLEQIAVNCAKRVEAYEKSLGLNIIGVKRNDLQEISYAVMLKDGSVDLFSSIEVKNKWPHLLQNFLVSRIQFPEGSRITSAPDMTETKKLVIVSNVAPPPNKILGK